MQPLDLTLLHWAKEIDLPIHILLTKCDKLKSAEARKTLFAIQSKTKLYPSVTVQLFSSLNKTGCDEARKCLIKWYSCH